MKKTLSATETDGGAEGLLTLTPLSGSPFSLYFHVPFCTRKCDYCHFYVVPDQERFKNLYMDALKREWDKRKPLLPNSSPLSIYLGGGTPSLLSPDQIATILNWVSPSDDCEITLEVNPENVSLERMRAFHQCGINRISLGIQSFNDAELTQLSRTHGADKAISAIEITSQAGFNNISIDLMYDLPNQSLNNWRKTIEQAVQLPITHLSLYNLTIEPHTSFYKKRNLLKQPPPETSLAMLNEACDRFAEESLVRYEISAFARRGCVSRHNTGYWTGRPFLGLGPSAFSYWNEIRFRNVANLHQYAKRADPIDFEEKLEPLERVKEKLAIGLRLLEGIPIENYPRPIENALLQLLQQNLVEKSETHLKLSSQGLLFHDTVAETIINC